MTINESSLSATDKIALAAIGKNPGITANDLAKHLPRSKPTSTSAIGSRLTRLRLVNRVKVPMSSAFRYYPLKAKLPEGHDEWDNALYVVHRRRKAKSNGQGASVSVAPPAPAPTPAPAPVPTLDDAASGLLLTLEVGDRQSVTLTVEQAKKFYLQLASLFAR